MKAATTTTTSRVPATELEDRETFDLISADKVEGTAVYNRAGEKLGSVDRVMIDKFSGKVPYAVMSFGGFLGMGEKYFAVPWTAMRFDRDGKDVDAVVLDVTKEQLEKAPTFTRDNSSPLGV